MTRNGNAATRKQRGEEKNKAKWQKEAHRHKRRVEECEEQISALRAQLSALGVEPASAASDVSSVGSASSTSAPQVTSTTHASASSSEHAPVSRQEFEDLKGKLLGVQREFEASKSSRALLDQQVADSSRRIDELENERAALEDKERKARYREAIARNLYQTNSHELHKAEARVNLLETRTLSLEEEKNAHLRTAKELRNKLRSADDDKARLLAEMQSLTQERSAFADRASELEARLHAQSPQTAGETRLADEKAELEARLRDSSAQLALALEEKSALKARLSALTDAMKTPLPASVPHTPHAMLVATAEKTSPITPERVVLFPEESPVRAPAPRASAAPMSWWTSMVRAIERVVRRIFGVFTRRAETTPLLAAAC